MMPRVNFYRRRIKPAADRLLAGTALLVLSPLLVAVAALVRLRMGQPIIFSQIRIGIADRPFQLFKFRTMSSQRYGTGSLLPDAARLTRLGRLLRSSSLDELPQLWNVVRGDMSLIGPRPLHPEYVSRYSDFQRRRHEVKPGITGLAQVSGRNFLDWDRKFELDVRYVDTCSAKLDLRILLMTIISILRRHGISPADQVTSPPFLGAGATRDSKRAERAHTSGGTLL